MKSGTAQTPIKLCIEKGIEQNHQGRFNVDLCKALVSANIPLRKLDNIEFKTFLKTYCKFNIPDESTLRKKGVEVVYTSVIEKIRDEISDNYFYITVDETTDACGRYMCHLMIGVLKEEAAGRSYLIASKEIAKTNNLTVTRFVQESLANFFLPITVPAEKILVLLSDAAPYMLKVGQNLKIFYPNIIHVTCLAHGLNRIAEAVRSEFPLVNELISNVKKIFIKAPLRVQLYRDHFPGIPLPPQPIITRWGTWINAAIFYAEHFDKLKNFILEFVDDSQCVIKSQELLKNKLIAQQLVFIRHNYSFIPNSITALEKRGSCVVESLSIVSKFVINCKLVQGQVGKKIVEKMNKVFEKNYGYKHLINVSKIFIGDEVPVDLNLEYSLLNNFKYCPITSVDVERSFSLFKNILSDKRHRFLIENFEKHIVIQSFYNVAE